MIETEKEIIIGINEWRKILKYRSPIKTHVFEPSFLAKLFGAKPHIFVLGGWQKHPIIKGRIFKNGKEYFRDKKIVIKGKELNFMAEEEYEY